jgi:hypothetical protein
MRYLIEAGTDAATLLLFDPAALPTDFEHQFQSDASGTLERLHRQGLACWIPVAGDGSYLLHVYLDEPIPPALRFCLREPVVIANFPAPSGWLHFTGAEYAFRDDDTTLAQNPRMGGSAVIAPGTYQLTLFCTLYPPGYISRHFRASVSRLDYALWASMYALVPLAVAAWIVLVVILFTTVRVPFPSFLAPLLMAVLSLPFLVRRLPAYKSVKERYASVERQFPALVAQLESSAPIRYLDEME